jgi:hypothetical protein
MRAPHHPIVPEPIDSNNPKSFERRHSLWTATTRENLERYRFSERDVIERIALVRPNAPQPILYDVPQSPDGPELSVPFPGIAVESKLAARACTLHKFAQAQDVAEAEFPEMSQRYWVDVRAERVVHEAFDVASSERL